MDMMVFGITLDAQALPVAEIIRFAETEAVTGNILREYLITRLLADDNVLARVLQETAQAGESLKAAALADITALLGTLETAAGWLAAYTPSVRRQMRFGAYQRSLEAIVAAEGPAAVLEGIIAHYRAFGGGPEARHIAMIWDKGLVGVDRLDGISLERLYCLASQKQALEENTEAFLRGLPANNVLLYGNSGCGKSSMVKALLDRYHGQGLRLVQIQKEDLAELPQLMRRIGGRRLRYIVFMDDLSFESDDLGYKTLKTILDGGVEKQPDNVLFYATSNRLHLICESWAEREGKDVHVTDTRNEKLSLSERFGIRVSFLSPDQKEYLAMVEGILAEAGIEATDALRAEAVRWAWQCNGLSGRTAAQFAAMVRTQAADGRPS